MASMRKLIDDIKQTVLGYSKTKNWAENASEVYAATIGGLKEYGGDTLSKTANNFNDALPYIERAGYTVTDIEVGIGLSPKIVPHLRLREFINPEERTKLLNEVRNKRMVHTILSSLFKATAARKQLQFQHFHFSDIEMELSLLPTVILKFKPNKHAGHTEQSGKLLQQAENLGLFETNQGKINT